MFEGLFRDVHVDGKPYAIYIKKSYDLEEWRPIILALHSAGYISSTDILDRKVTNPITQLTEESIINEIKGLISPTRESNHRYTDIYEDWIKSLRDKLWQGRRGYPLSTVWYSTMAYVFQGQFMSVKDIPDELILACLALGYNLQLSSEFTE